jgi:ribosomal protein L7/L12
MKRGPTEEENAKIAAAIFAGDRVEATSIYLSLTECGLTEAQEFIRELTARLEESNPEKFSRKKRKRTKW